MIRSENRKSVFSSRIFGVVFLFLFVIVFGLVYQYLNSDGTTEVIAQTMAPTAKQTTLKQISVKGIVSPFASCKVISDCEREGISSLHTANSRSFTDEIDSLIAKIKMGDQQAQEDALAVLLQCHSFYRVDEFLSANNVKHTIQYGGCGYQMLDYFLTEIDSAVVTRLGSISGGDQRIIDEAKWLVAKAKFEDQANAKLLIEDEQRDANTQPTVKFSEPANSSPYWDSARSLISNVKIESLDSIIIAGIIPIRDKLVPVTVSNDRNDFELDIE